MAPMSISVSSYITPGTAIEAKFVNTESDKDEMKWYKGIVQDVNSHGVDKSGSQYTECDIIYSDGEVVLGWRFYDEDYGEEWKFVSCMSELIDDLLERVEELEECDVDDGDEDYDCDDEEGDCECDDCDCDDCECEDCDCCGSESETNQKLDIIIQKMESASLVHIIIAFAIATMSVTLGIQSFGKFVV